MSIRFLALDLEQTLIDDALGEQPRSGLLEFLSFCYATFEKIFLFTTVDEATVNEVMENLEKKGAIPEGFLEQLEYVNWEGEHKDLKFVPVDNWEEILFVDDDAGWISPDQKNQWLSIVPWDGKEDRELQRIQEILEKRVMS